MLSASARTARITLRRKKEPMITSITLKMTAIHQIFESISKYMTVVHYSSVIIWKIVSMAHPKLSKPIRL